MQANPVSTTTDSNLLDGEWSFAFQTNSASTILDTRRFLLSKTKRPAEEEDESQDNTGNAGSTVRGGPWRFRSGKTENPFRSSTREIYLENLSGDENAHVIDETRVLGGLFQISRRYDVFGLTRTAIDLDLTESESRLFGFVVNSKGSDEIKGTNLDVPLEIQVLYLDTDLCICTTGAGLDGPLHVYTKSDLWVTGGAKRKVSHISCFVNGCKWPVHHFDCSYTYLYAVAANCENRFVDIDFAVSTSHPTKIGQHDIKKEGEQTIGCWPRLEICQYW